MDDWNDFGYDDSRTPRASDARISLPPRRPTAASSTDLPPLPSHASLPLPGAAPRRITTAPASYGATNRGVNTNSVTTTDDNRSINPPVSNSINSINNNSRVYELADSYSSFSSSAGGGAGSVTGAEPRSIMMPMVPKRTPPSSIIPPAPSASNNSPNNGGGGGGDKNMDLDDADLEEWGSSRSGRYNTGSSSSDRYHKPSYTKLEVFSGQQIQQLLNCFHLVVTLAVCWTLFAIIIGNVGFASTEPIPVRKALLSEKQIREAQAREAASKEPQVAGTTGITPNGAARFLIPNLILDTSARTSTNLNRYGFGYEFPGSRECYFCYMERLDICYEWNSFIRCRKPNRLQHCADCDQPTLALTAGERAQYGFPAADGLDIGTTARQSGWSDTEFMEIRFERQDEMYKQVTNVVIILCGVLLLVLGTLFVIRLVRTGRKNVSQEQMFACAMLFGSFLYFTVPLALGKVWFKFLPIKVELLGGTRGFFPDLLNRLTEPLTAMRFCFFPPFFFFFLWANIHSYRILDPSKKLDAAFYLPKIALLVPLLGIKLGAFHSQNVRTSIFPFISIIALQHSFGRFNFRRAFPGQFWFIIALTLYEAFLVAYSCWQAVITTRALRKVPYMRHRSKHTGFRFFMYINLVFYLTYFLLQVLTIVGKPFGGPILRSGLGQAGDFRVQDTEEAGCLVLLFGYVVIWAYVNLPYDSVGAVKGWFKATELAPSTMRWSSFSGKDSNSASCGIDSDTASGTESNSYSQGYGSRARRPASDTTPIFKVDRDHELNQEIAEPITYRKRESDKSVELKANCFTMQTHVILFNFAWYVYYYGTPKFEAINQSEEEQILPFQFDIAESIREPSTDTQALVINSDDRIIVTFKGSTSLRNLKTSLAAFHEKLRNVVPTNIDNGNEMERIQEIFGRVYESAKIHKGFAMAYASVAHRVMNAIKLLHDEKPRPIFLTGHSLGGALATICSLDVWVKLRISRRQIFVSTFGSPRVGNDAFKKIYNSVIALHWRIVVDPDMVAKLPKGMYRHVGKKVMLTQHGDLFIDPSALELKLWSGSTAGFAYHRKASYLLAMEAWCLRHHKLSYVPKFWEFPVRDEDRQRFQGAIADPEASMHINMDDSMAPRSRLIKKIILLDAMVDSLDDGTGPQNAAAVEKWARLTRRLLLRAKLAATVTGTHNNTIDTATIR